MVDETIAAWRFRPHPLISGGHAQTVAGALSAGSTGALPRRLATFNTGRIGSYALAGAMAGALGGLASAAGPEAVIRTVLFVAARVKHCPRS